MKTKPSQLSKVLPLVWAIFSGLITGSAFAQNSEDFDFQYERETNRFSGNVLVEGEKYGKMKSGYMTFSGQGAGDEDEDSTGSGDFVFFMNFLSGDAWLYNFNGSTFANDYNGSEMLGYFQNSVEVDNSWSREKSVNFDYNLSRIEGGNLAFLGVDESTEFTVATENRMIKGNNHGVIGLKSQPKDAKNWDYVPENHHDVPEIDDDSD